ncbi:uncharacterized protein LOC102155494 [Canis lupus familiaris]|uniref:uncharacterized protein LOC112669463 n=1 Tax=Canis lupus dingo TaxID=286419 RepID=UPI0015F165DF|nr:uncharacterized protein LOC112669463 [Canis lupus dingo]XP_038290598.1 uncharacterized protein LOC102155494 [Canis lupus familiaris]XP_038314514.1 uncharacterized protein LOC102155494 [Canis lupus familiaris]XP_038430421.1 uncharacterized protein LOC102155494 [Canis lupus familiaris]
MGEEERAGDRKKGKGCRRRWQREEVKDGGHWVVSLFFVSGFQGLSEQHTKAISDAPGRELRGAKTALRSSPRTKADRQSRIWANLGGCVFSSTHLPQESRIFARAHPAQPASGRRGGGPCPHEAGCTAPPPPRGLLLPAKAPGPHKGPGKQRSTSSWKGRSREGRASASQLSDGRRGLQLWADAHTRADAHQPWRWVKALGTNYAPVPGGLLTHFPPGRLAGLQDWARLCCVGQAEGSAFNSFHASFLKDRGSSWGTRVVQSSGGCLWVRS